MLRSSTGIVVSIGSMSDKILMVCSDRVMVVDKHIAAAHQSPPVVLKQFDWPGIRAALFHPMSKHWLVFTLDKPVQIFNENWELVGETDAHFMGKMLSNRWDATNRGAKLVGNIVYYLALPDGFQKDAQRISLDGMPGWLRRIDMLIIATLSLSRSDINFEEEIAEDVEDFHIDHVSYVITYISRKGIVYRLGGPNKKPLLLSAHSVTYFTNIIKVGSRFVAAGWKKDDNTVVYFLVVEEEQQFGLRNFVSVKNEQSPRDPKGPLSQLVTTFVRFEGRKLPVIVGGTTTGALHIMGVSRDSIIPLVCDYGMKSNGNFALSIFVENETVYVAGKIIT